MFCYPQSERGSQNAMSQATKLTAVKVENVKPDKTKRIEIHDLGKPGLYLVVQPSGRKSWAVRYRQRGTGKNRKYTLQGFPSLATARQLAQKALDRIAEGHDPAADKQAERQKAATSQSNDVDTAFRLFLDKRLRTRSGRPIRESTRVEIARLLGYRRDPTGLLDDWLPSGNGVLRHWKGRPLQSIKPVDVRALLEAVSARGPIVANRTLTVLKTFFTWHVRRDPDLLTRSPCDGIDAPTPESGGRERVLSDAELAAVWRAAAAMGYPYGRMVQMLVLTGCRRDEVRDALWAEFDMSEQRWLIPGGRTKNGHGHLVPITDTMAEILDALPRIQGRDGKTHLLFSFSGNGVMGGLSNLKRRLDALVAEALGEQPPRWTLHDLRRTFVTGLQRLRFPLEVAEACVNHTSGTVGGVTGVYARHGYEDEKREALTAWGRHVMGLVEGRPPAKVVSLRGRK